MRLSNGQIYSYILQMNEAFEGYSEKLPAKLNFYINRNEYKIFELAKIIECTRDDIMKTEQNEELRNYKLKELSEIEQEVDIKMIPIEWLSNDIKFTQPQMLSIMWMIDDSEQKEIYNGKTSTDTSTDFGSTDDN